MNKFQEIIFEAGALRKVCKHGEAIVRQGYPLAEPRLVFGRKGGFQFCGNNSVRREMG